MWCWTRLHRGDGVIGPYLLPCLLGVLLLDGLAAAQPSAPGSSKLAPLLAQVLGELERASLLGQSLVTPAPERFSTPLVRVDGHGRIQVYVHVDRLDDATLASLVSAGLVIEQTSPKHRIVQGWIPFERLRGLAALASVRRVGAPDYAVPKAPVRQPTPRPDPARSPQ